MKKVFNKVKAFLEAKTPKNEAIMNTRMMLAKAKLAETHGDFVMNHTVVFVICLAVGLVVLGLLIAYVTNNLTPMLESKVTEFFN